jgi:hypothetical protein
MHVGSSKLRIESDSTLPMKRQSNDADRRLPEDFRYVIVKHNPGNDAVTFTLCPDFDTAEEPNVGDSILVRVDGTFQKRQQLDDPYIYHHKWLMVKDDYSEFDVDASKERSLAWISLPDVDRTRIGRKSFWVENVLPRIEDSNWLKSIEIMKRLRLSTCELSHLREAGKLTYRKKGNAYLYLDDEEVFAKLVQRDYRSN